MAWFSDITGKAEEFLNNIDKGAADALQSSSRSPAPKVTYSLSVEDGPRMGSKFVAAGSNPSSSYFSGNSLAGQSSGAAASSDITPRRDYKSSGYASSITSSIISSNRVKEDPEEKLMEYLNDSTNASPGPGGGNTSANSKTAGHSRRSSASSVRSMPLQALQSIQSTIIGSTFVRTESETGSGSNSKDYPVASGGGGVASYSLADRELSDNRARILDLERQIQSKDSQLAILRVKLQEANEQVETRERKLRLANSDKEKLRKEVSLLKAKENDLSMNSDLAQAQSKLDIERSEARKNEAEFLAKLHQLEDEKQSLTQELISLQRTITEERLQGRDSLDQLQLAKYNLEANKQDFDEYKHKAQRILQSKDKLIETLKSGVTDGDEASQSELQIQLTELEQERELLREDLQQAQMLQYTMKAEMQELESQLSAEQRSSLETQRSLQTQAQSFQLQSSEYRDQAERYKQECQVLQDEMTRQLLTLQTKLQQKSSEIERLTNQVAAKSVNSSSESELEGRIRSLTENLIQKQTSIETLQTERHSLQLQLERMDKLYREAESAAVQNAATSIHIGNVEDGLQQRIPSFLHESPYDTGVTHGLKKAYGSLDSVSVKFGIFLRRYPIARVMVFVYIVILHVWVMIVLLTYTPEIHPAGYHS